MNGVESIREMLRRNPDKLNRRSGSRRECGQMEIDKFWGLAYNILIKTASKGSQGSPSWQDICLRRSRLFFTREQGGYFLCVYVRIDTIKLAVVRIIINIS